MPLGRSTDSVDGQNRRFGGLAVELLLRVRHTWPGRSPATLNHGFQVNKTIGALIGKKTAGWSQEWWKSENIVVYPAQIQELDNFSKFIEEYALTGHIPAKPLLGDDDALITLGSCFARELRFFLGRYGLSAGNFVVPSGLNNTFALVDFITWATTGKTTARAYRYDRNEDGNIIEWMPDLEQREYSEAFSNAGAILLTLGLSEVWEDRETGRVFWRGVPEEIYNDGRHRFRLSTVEENVANIETMISAVREVNESAPIVFALSPVPLKATFRGQSCITADCVSKSILRVALDSVISDGRKGVYYFPSFEIVRWLGCNMSFPSFGAEDGTTNHVSRFFVINILKAFVKSFYLPEARERFMAGLRGDGVPDDTSRFFVLAAGKKLS